MFHSLKMGDSLEIIVKEEPGNLLTDTENGGVIQYMKIDQRINSYEESEPRLVNECIDNQTNRIAEAELEKIVKFETYYVKEEIYSDEEKDLSVENLKVDVEHTLSCKEYKNEVDVTRCDIDNTDYLVNKHFEFRSLFENITPSSSEFELKLISATVDEKSSELSELLHEHNEKHFEGFSEDTYMKLNVYKKNKRYHCEDCNKKFHVFCLLRNHINGIHLGVKEYKCKQCSKTYSHISNLRKHINSIHKNIKNFECQFCNKRFSIAHYLNQHVSSVHEGIKNYECYECCKKYFKFHDLKIHINTVHMKIRKFKCELCNKRFFMLSHLKNHTDAVHEKIRNYKCILCDKTYLRQGHLHKHIYTTHKELV